MLKVTIAIHNDKEQKWRMGARNGDRRVGTWTWVRNGGLEIENMDGGLRLGQGFETKTRIGDEDRDRLKQLRTQGGVALTTWGCCFRNLVKKIRYFLTQH